jgi:hypothetical protein
MAGMLQLRRYEIKPGELDAFVEWWQGILPVREQYGFSVRFAFVDEAASEFVWGVSHEGDFEEAERVYNASPERAAVLARVGDRVAATHVSMVRVEVAPW